MAESNPSPGVPFTPEPPPPRPADTARRLRAESIALRQRAARTQEARRALRDGFVAALGQIEPRAAVRDDALSDVRAAREKLRDGATRLAVLLRASGATPEAMIVEVKSVLGAAAPAVWGTRREALTAEVVRWSIVAFYAS